MNKLIRFLFMGILRATKVEDKKNKGFSEPFRQANYFHEFLFCDLFVFWTILEVLLYAGTNLSVQAVAGLRGFGYRLSTLRIDFAPVALGIGAECQPCPGRQGW